MSYIFLCRKPPPLILQIVNVTRNIWIYPNVVINKGFTGIIKYSINQSSSSSLTIIVK